MKLYLVNKFIPQTSTKFNSYLIPPNIFQTWESNSVPEGMYNAINSWVKKNPEFNYYLYDSSDRIKFVEDFNCDEFSFSNNDLLKAFNDLNHNAAKADIWRYLILYVKGGIYTDIDTKCIIPLKKYIGKNNSFVNGLNNRNQLFQTFILSAPKHPFIKELIELTITNILNKRFINEWPTLKSLTGPTTLNYAIKQYLGLLTDKEKSFRADIDNQYHFKYGTYQLGGLEVNFIPNFIDKYIKFQYKGYKEEVNKLDLPHWQDANKGIFIN